MMVRIVLGISQTYSSRELWSKSHDFSVYLFLVGLLSTVVFCITTHFLMLCAVRYVLLSLFCSIGILISWFLFEKNYQLRTVGIIILLIVAFYHGFSHFELIHEYYKKPPINAYRDLLEVLKKEGIKYAKAGYWTAYYVTFLSNEDIIVASSGMVRIPTYNDLYECAPKKVLISQDPCKGKEIATIHGLHICTPN